MRRDEGRKRRKFIVPSITANLYSCEREFYAEALILRNAIYENKQAAAPFNNNAATAAAAFVRRGCVITRPADFHLGLAHQHKTQNTHIQTG